MKKNMWYTIAVLVGLALIPNPVKGKDETTSGVSMMGDFFQAVEGRFGVLDSIQASSLEMIINAFNKYGDGDVRKLAYIIATAYHESKIRPIKEIRAAQGTNLHDIQNQYWYTGYYGRGFVQLTWKTNYEKMADFLGVDFVSSPDLVLDPFYASEIIVYGMMNGSFTGKPLSNYINGSMVDYYNARKVVNGTDRALQIKGYAQGIASRLQMGYV